MEKRIKLINEFKKRRSSKRQLLVKNLNTILLTRAQKRSKKNTHVEKKKVQNPLGQAQKTFFSVEFLTFKFFRKVSHVIEFVFYLNNTFSRKFFHFLHFDFASNKKFRRKILV